MRLALAVALVLALIAVLSCADMPVSPRSMVTLEGSVLDRDGAPLERVRLYFLALEGLPESSGPYAPPLGSTETGADGSFRLQLPEGEYAVRIYPPYDPGTGLPEGRIARFKLDQEGARLDYRYSGVFVSGRVIGPGGSALSQALVGAYSLNGTTGASTQSKDGAYKLLLTPGRFRFYATSGSYDGGLPRFEFDATIPPQDTTIDLDFSGHEIKVIVTYQGAPLLGAGVSAEMQGVQASARTNIEGVARLYLPTGGYALRVFAGVEGITGPEETYQFVGGDGTVSFDLSGVAWDVTLRRQDDLSAIAEASVGVFEIGRNRSGYTRSDGDGKFRMIVQPNWGHDVQVVLPFQVSGSYPTFTVNGIASSADSTFDLLLDAPPLP